MIRASILLLLAATPTLAAGEEDYLAALEVAAREAQAEHDRLAPVYTGLPSHEEGGSKTVTFYREGPSGSEKIEDVTAEIVAIFDDTASICTWGYDTDIMPTLPRTAALAVKAHAETHMWPATATDQWSSTMDACIGRTNLATSIGDLMYITRLAVGPHIIFFGISPAAPSS